MSSVKKFAKTKHKGLPEKKVASEGVVDAIKKIKLNKTKVKKSPYSGRDAGAIAAKVMRQKQHNKYVNFLPVDEELNQKDKPYIKKLVKNLRKGSNTHAKQADKLEKAMNEESNPRIPRKKGQPANSKKHSDLYTDENPKGTIHGLGFKDVKLLLKHLSQRSGILLDRMLIRFKRWLLWNKGRERWVKPLKRSISKIHKYYEEKN